jgi:dolichol-phosphate mannosyltransferase
MSPQLTIVLPAYKEAECLRDLLPRLKQAADTLTADYEILVVDAQQPVDDTRSVCERNEVRHKFREDGNGYGDAVRSGIAASQGKYVIFMDADGSHNPAALRRLWLEREGNDVVIGSRYVEGGETENPIGLIWMSRVVNVVYRVVLNLQVHDVSNSLRLYRGDQLKRVRPTANNFDIVEELLIQLAFGPCHDKIKEIPVKFERRKAGASKRNLVVFAASYLSTLIRLMRFRHAALRAAREGAGG